ncbi:MAG: HPP family protein, partial [archaeon GB-1845-036]|nr:HPP family protein [Candidatus Culexmicrobium thermophilum]
MASIGGYTLMKIKSWKKYVFQSFLATLIVLLLILILKMEHIVVIASIGSTAFIVFALPKSITARPKNVIGGQIIGLLSGSICALIPHSSFISSIIVYSVAVGLSIFLMITTDTAHPPASGTALGIAITGFSINIALSLIISVTILSFIHHFLKPF